MWCPRGMPYVHNITSVPHMEQAVQLHAYSSMAQQQSMLIVKAAAACETIGFGRRAYRKWRTTRLDSSTSGGRQTMRVGVTSTRAISMPCSGTNLRDRSYAAVISPTTIARPYIWASTFTFGGKLLKRGAPPICNWSSCERHCGRPVDWDGPEMPRRTVDTCLTFCVAGRLP